VQREKRRTCLLKREKSCVMWRKRRGERGVVEN
jgi:hypothetical protein